MDNSGKGGKRTDSTNLSYDHSIHDTEIPNRWLLMIRDIEVPNRRLLVVHDIEVPNRWLLMVRDIEVPNRRLLMVRDIEVPNRRLLMVRDIEVPNRRLLMVHDIEVPNRRLLMVHDFQVIDSWTNNVTVNDSHHSALSLQSALSCFTCMHVLCAMYMPGARKDQKTVSDSLDLELQMAMSFQGLKRKDCLKFKADLDREGRVWKQVWVYICEGAALTCDGEDNNLQEPGFYHVSPGEASGPPQVNQRFELLGKIPHVVRDHVLPSGCHDTQFHKIGERQGLRAVCVPWDQDSENLVHHNLHDALTEQVSFGDKLMVHAEAHFHQEVREVLGCGNVYTVAHQGMAVLVSHFWLSQASGSQYRKQSGSYVAQMKTTDIQLNSKKGEVTLGYTERPRFETNKKQKLAVLGHICNLNTRERELS
ncbi:hypothetical protein U0070_007416 [Myodes glareolus]|uniref:Uncharacterized protein n=1 Tax=Myodes glareolus TaxID=447135 RepID=A0AAW0HY91_MYOGA